MKSRRVAEHSWFCQTKFVPRLRLSPIKMSRSSSRPPSTQKFNTIRRRIPPYPPKIYNIALSYRSLTSTRPKGKRKVGQARSLLGAHVAPPVACVGRSLPLPTEFLSKADSLALKSSFIRATRTPLVFRNLSWQIVERLCNYQSRETRLSWRCGAPLGGNNLSPRARGAPARARLSVFCWEHALCKVRSPQDASLCL